MFSLSRTEYYLAAACLAIFCGRATAAELVHPNIVLIVCDDLGFSDLGCYGSEIETPNLDRLAGDGMRFSHFYNCSACGETRAALITGLYPRNGARLSKNMTTIGRILQNAGYQTSISGKWNVQRQEPSSPLAWGFDEFYGMPDGSCNFFDPSLPDPAVAGSPGNRRLFMHNQDRVTSFPSEYYLTDAITDHAIEMIRRARSQNVRFFTYVAYTAPHSPLQAKTQDIAVYKDKYKAGWDQLRLRRHERLVRMGLINATWVLPERDPEVTSWETELQQDWQDTRMAIYAAMVESVDRNIGRICKVLAENGLQKDTLILFMSDNGPASADLRGSRPHIGDGIGDGPDSPAVPGTIDSYLTCGAGWAHLQATPFRRFKVWIHEGGIASPLIAWWPGTIQANAIRHDIFHVIDIVPTVAEIIEGCSSDHVGPQKLLPWEGESMLSVLKGNSGPRKRRLYWHNPHIGSAAIREDNWKLVSEGPGMHWELYDMQLDRTETNDLSHTYQQRVDTMAKQWHKWAKAIVGDTEKLPP